MKVAHIVPSMDIGGVEIGIKKSKKEISEFFDYKVFFVKKMGSLKCGQKSIFNLFLLLLSRRWVPDVIVTSLWWSHIFGEIFQRLFGIYWVSFFHSNNYTHKFDRFFIGRAWNKSNICMVDSEATAVLMCEVSRRRYYIVPYVFKNNICKKRWAEREIDFIWVGRIVKEKRVDLLIKFLTLLQDKTPKARIALVVVGELPIELLELQRENKLIFNFFQNSNNSDLLNLMGNSKFYLLFSDFEGMSMSTVEAIQAGCLPVVRRVGEIASYLSAEACIEISDISENGLSEVIDAVSDLASDSGDVERRIDLANRAINNLSNYVDSFVSILGKIK